MRTLLFAAAIVLTGVGSPAWADFDAHKVAAIYDDFRPACRQAEYLGQPIKPNESERYCIILTALGDQLTANGWCWDKAEVEWRACKKD